MENTYAATSSSTFIAIAARFDLELKQYDAVNAFVHASLDEEIYIRKPPGYRNDDKILKLKNTLSVRKRPGGFREEESIPNAQNS
jgi:Reverse transcriptase (RNA-dependent DNA polymerase)